jgi:hypothetical protein
MMMVNAIGAQSMMASGRECGSCGWEVGLVGCSFHVYQNGFKAIFSAGSLIVVAADVLIDRCSHNCT